MAFLEMKKKNPNISHASYGKGMVEIYDSALETHARKGDDSVFPKEEFVHDWEAEGTKVLGLPKGTIIQTPDGDRYKLKNRDVLMDGKKDLWDLFEQGKSRNPRERIIEAVKRVKMNNAFHKNKRVIAARKRYKDDVKNGVSERIAWERAKIVFDNVKDELSYMLNPKKGGKR